MAQYADQLLQMLQVAGQNPNVLQQLHATATQMEESNFPQFISALATIMAAESVEFGARRQVSLMLKNLLLGHDAEIKKQKADRWLALDEETKKCVRELTYNTLSSPRVGKDAAQVLANIGMIDMPNGYWKNLPTILGKNVLQPAENTPPVLLEYSLLTIGYLVEGIDAKDIQDFSSLIMSCVLTSLKPESSESVKLTAIKTLNEIIVLCKSNFENDEEMKEIMSNVLRVCHDKTQERLVEEMYQVLLKITNAHYEKLNVYMGPIYKMTLSDISGANEDIGKIAAEFWSTISEMEKKRTKFEKPIHHFTKGALPQLVPTLCKAMTRLQAEYDPNELTLPISASRCLDRVAETVRNDICDHVWPFIKDHITHNSWNVREAAILALNALLSADSHQIANIISEAIPMLVSNVREHQVVSVKVSCLWILSRIFEQHYSVAAGTSETVLQIMCTVLEDPFPTDLIEHASFVIRTIAEVSEEDTNSPIKKHYEVVMSKIFGAAHRNGTTFEQKLNAYSALGSVIPLAEESHMGILEQVTITLLQELEGTLGQGQDIAEIQEIILGALQVLNLKFKERISSYSDRLMKALLTLLNSPTGGIVASEVLITFNGVLYALGPQSERYADEIIKYVEIALKNPSDKQTCMQAIPLVGALCAKCPEKMQSQFEKFAKVFYTMLKNPNIDRSLRPRILETLSDMSMHMTATQFINFIADFLAVLRSFTDTMIRHDVDYMNEDTVEYMTDLRQTIFIAYSGMIYNLESSDKKQELLHPHGLLILQFVMKVMHDKYLLDNSMLMAALGCLGDIVKAIPSTFTGKIDPQLKQYITELAREKNRPQPVQEVANWVSSLIKGV